MVALHKKLEQSGRLQAVPHRQARPGFLNGLFAVIKNARCDRLILEGRPANCLEQKLDTWTSSMASASCLTDILSCFGAGFVVLRRGPARFFSTSSRPPLLGLPGIRCVNRYCFPKLRKCSIGHSLTILGWCFAGLVL